MTTVTGLASSHNSCRNSHTEGEVVIATVWLVFYSVILGITVITGEFSSTIDLAALH